ncbi:MAG TPA: (2Fe-2S)-binding protein [Candidatus Ozemobacteraceae bacterium]
MICYCKSVTKSTILDAIRAGARNLSDVRDATGACTGSQCAVANPKGRCCSGDITEILESELPHEVSTLCTCCGSKEE